MGHCSGLEPQEESHGSSLPCLPSTGLAGACIQGGTEINCGGLLLGEAVVEISQGCFPSPLQLTWSSRSDDEGALGDKDSAMGRPGWGLGCPKCPVCGVTSLLPSPGPRPCAPCLTEGCLWGAGPAGGTSGGGRGPGLTPPDSRASGAGGCRAEADTLMLARWGRRSGAFIRFGSASPGPGLWFGSY